MVKYKNLCEFTSNHLICLSYALWVFSDRDMQSMAECKTAVSLLLAHWRYSSLALNQRNLVQICVIESRGIFTSIIRDDNLIKHIELIYCDLMTPHGMTHLDQQWYSDGVALTKHQGTSWTKADFFATVVDLNSLKLYAVIFYRRLQNNCHSVPHTMCSV